MSDSVSTTRARFAIDAKVSRLTIKVTASGLLAALGHSPVVTARGFSGEVQCVPDTFEDASLRFRVGADTLTVQDGIMEKDRREIEQMMKTDVLEIGRFPEIVFESTNIVVSAPDSGPLRAQVSGRFSLHGVTRDLTIPVGVSVIGSMLRASGEFVVRQTDFGITPVSIAAGALKVKDDLQCAFDLVARQQP
jgi:polyisoprenoid-binding protein YceI